MRSLAVALDADLQQASVKLVLRVPEDEGGFGFGVGTRDVAREALFCVETVDSSRRWSLATEAFLEDARRLLPRAIRAARRMQPRWIRQAIEAGWNAPGTSGLAPESPPPIAEWMVEALREGWRPGDKTDLSTLSRRREETGPAADATEPSLDFPAFCRVVYEDIAAERLDPEEQVLILTGDFDVVRLFANRYGLDGLRRTPQDRYSFFVRRAVIWHLVGTGEPGSSAGSVVRELSADGIIPAFIAGMPAEGDLRLRPLPEPVPLPPGKEPRTDETGSPEPAHVAPGKGDTAAVGWQPGGGPRGFDEQAVRFASALARHQILLHHVEPERYCFVMVTGFRRAIALLSEMSGIGFDGNPGSDSYAFFVARERVRGLYCAGRFSGTGAPLGELLDDPRRMPVLVTIDEKDSKVGVVSFLIPLDGDAIPGQPPPGSSKGALN
jgi:hypothetical protein